MNINKTTNFIAEFGNTYDCDTTLGDIVVTLPSPVIVDGKSIGFINTGINKIVFSGQTINGVSSLKVIALNDFIQLIIIKNAFIIGSSNGYKTSTTKSWKETVSDLGVAIIIQTNN